MKAKNGLSYLGAFFIGGTILFSCNKAVNFTDVQQISVDHATAEQNSEDLSSINEQSEVKENMKDLKTSDAADIYGGDVIITKDKATNTTIIDFGNSYLGKNGRMFSGKVIKVSNGKKYYEEGYTATITLENYKVNGNKITGTKIITNKGLNVLGQMYWEITVHHSITKENGKTVVFNANRIRTIIAGAETRETLSDDKYSITGSGSGTASNGMTFEMTIIKPIIRDMSCRERTSGIIEYKAMLNDSNAKTRTLDYGDGTCDDIATLTVNGQTRTINLR